MGCITTPPRHDRAKCSASSFPAWPPRSCPAVNCCRPGGQPAALLTSAAVPCRRDLHSGVCTQITAGVKIVLLEGKFDPDRVMQAIEREKITIVAGDPDDAPPASVPRAEHFGLRPDLRCAAFSFRRRADGARGRSDRRARKCCRSNRRSANAYGLTETPRRGHGECRQRRCSVARPSAGRVAPDARLQDRGRAGPARLPPELSEKYCSTVRP